MRVFTDGRRVPAWQFDHLHGLMLGFWTSERYPTILLDLNNQATE